MTVLNILLAFIAGILVGVVVTKTDDTFLDSLRKWLDEETKDEPQKRIGIEYDIEKTLPNFRKWVKEKKEGRRKHRRKYFLYYLLVLTLMLLIYIMQIIFSEDKQTPSVFQRYTTQQSVPKQEAATPKSTEETTNQ